MSYQAYPIVTFHYNEHDLLRHLFQQESLISIFHKILNVSVCHDYVFMYEQSGGVIFLTFLAITG